MTLTSSSNLMFLLLSSLWMLKTRCAAQPQPPLVDCDPCIKRSEYTLQAILHGTSSDLFWLEMQASMRQAALDMGVSLIIELSEVFNAQIMAQEIKNAAASNDIDALIVTIPNDIVQEAVAQVIADGMPVFGVNVGYEVAQELGILGYAAQDDYLAGQQAGEEFLKNSNVSSAVFINPDSTSQTMQARQNGFADYLLEQAGIVVDTLLLMDPDSIHIFEPTIEAVFENCPYHAVLLGGYESVSVATTAFEKHECQQITQVGAMEGNQDISDAIVQNSLVFGMTQQPYLQAAFPVLLAALYVTTGKKVALPLEEKVYLSGPVTWTKANLPSDSLQTCELDAFPICPNTGGIVEGVKADCACVDRPTIRIGGVLHGVTTDSFWDPVFTSSRQAALDMDIELDLERFLPQETNDLIYEQMAARIRNLCESGVDGIFVTIPTDTVIESIQRCQQLNVPVVSINSGRDVSQELGLIHHVGMIEYNAGVGAGERMIAAGMKRGFCLDHAFGNTATADRCRGFGDAIAASGDVAIIYEGHFDVPPDNRAQYKVLVEGFVNDNGDWAGVGLMAIGPQQLPATREVVADHPAAIAGTFDVGPIVTEGLADGLLVFGVDQGPFFQGNLPVYLLTYLAYTRQHLINFDIESGPTFVTEPPSDAEKMCEANFYEVCPDRPAEDFNYISHGFLLLGYVLFAVLALASISAASWTWHHREKWVVKVGQPQLLGMVILGCFLSSLSILFMGVQTGYRQNQDSATGEPTGRDNTDISRVDASCMAWPWLYGLGFVITFSSLFAKIQRVKLIYLAGRQMQRRTIEFKDVAYIVAFMLVIETSILLSWQIASPLRWEREVLTEEDSFPVESVGSCTSDDGWHYFLALVLFHVACLFYALVLCFQTKDINSDFAESSYLSLAAIFMFQVLVLAVPISVLVQDNADVFYFVRACAIFLQNLTVLTLLFVPKMFRVSEVQSEEARGSGQSSTIRYSLDASRPTRRISGMLDSGMTSNDGDSSHLCTLLAASSSAANIVANSACSDLASIDEVKKKVRFDSEGRDVSGAERSPGVSTSASIESNAGRQANHQIREEEAPPKESSPAANRPLDEADWAAQQPQESQGFEPATVPSIPNEDLIQIHEPIASPNVQDPSNPNDDATLQNQPASRALGEVASTGDDLSIAAPEDPTIPLELPAQLLTVAWESQSSTPKTISLLSNGPPAGETSEDNLHVNDTPLAANTPSEPDVLGDLLDGSISSDNGYETMYRPSELAADWESLGFESKEHALAVLALVSLNTNPEQRRYILSELTWMKKKY
jgi:simple sugar transport system substrate-binding protein